MSKLWFLLRVIPSRGSVNVCRCGADEWWRPPRWVLRALRNLPERPLCLRCCGYRNTTFVDAQTISVYPSPHFGAQTP